MEVRGQLSRGQTKIIRLKPQALIPLAPSLSLAEWVEQPLFCRLGSLNQAFFIFTLQSTKENSPVWVACCFIVPTTPESHHASHGEGRAEESLSLAHSSNIHSALTVSQTLVLTCESLRSATGTQHTSDVVTSLLSTSLVSLLTYCVTLFPPWPLCWPTVLPRFLPCVDIHEASFEHIVSCLTLLPPPH